MKTYLYIIITWLFPATVLAGSRQPEFIHIKADDGLPHNTVFDMIQDRKGFIWFATMNGLARYDGVNFKTFYYEPQSDPDELNGLKNNYIVSLFEDKDGCIWVGTIDGVFIYQPRYESFQRFSVLTGKGEQINGKILKITADTDGNIWIVSYGHGIFRYNPDTENLHLFRHTEEPNSISSDMVMDVYVDSGGAVWIGVLGSAGSGVNLFNPDSQTFTLYSLSDIYSNIGVSRIIGNEGDTLLLGTLTSGVYLMNKKTKKTTPLANEELNSIFVTDMMLTGKKVWIAAHTGIYIHDFATEETFRISQNFADSRSLSSSAVLCFTKDREGGIWIGTQSGGVNYLPDKYSVFEKFYPTGNSNGLNGTDIKDICEDHSGIIWLATERTGLNRFDPETGNITHYTVENGKISSNEILSLMTTDDNIYLGYLGEGLEVINPYTNQRKKIIRNPDRVDNTVMAVCNVSDGTVWIGTTLELVVYSPLTGECSVMTEISDTYVMDICEDSRHEIWVATYGKGIGNYNPETKEWTFYRHRNANSDSSLCYDYCISLSEDKDGKIWTGTEGGGVSCFDPQTKKFQTYSKENGLPSNTVNKVVDDGLGNLWISTAKGLSRLNKETKNITTFNHSNGLLNDQLSYKSGIKSSKGYLYFGTTDGFIRFKPQDITKNEHKPAVVLTGFKVFNHDVDTRRLDSSIVTLPHIRLGHKESTLSISFAALSYSAPELNQYTCMMDNYDKDWIYAGNVNSVTYANMPPGDYLFRVKGANNDGVWNEEGVSLSIHISRPWWTSTVSLCLYTLIIMTMTYLTYKRYKYQKNQKMQQMIDNIQRAEEKSLYDAKIQFLSSVSHEIKTPLSLVKAPFEQICREGPASRNYQDNMEIIGMNIDRLVNLTHQLLDFSKAENDRFLFHTSLVDISQIVTNVMSHFTGVLKDKHIEPVFDLPNEDVVCYADPEALTKIMNNLIQNASRYALHKIKISLHKENDRFVIRVLNDGEVIPSEYHDKIFNRFYQISEDSHKGGVGLGLSIVKHLTDLHHGRVYLDDTSEDTCFVVEIPFVTKAPGNGTDPDTEDNTVQEEPVDECRSERRCSTILVVEDNKDMQRFLKKMLEEKYHVYLADNGKQAFEIMDKKNVDMIISDVMMPEMDGFTLCQEIKTNLKFSHIPVILLTAKTHISAKIQGIESGANAYIEKPFSSEFLLVKIHNILSNIKLLKDAFLHSPYTLTDSIVNSVADEQFIEKINSIILDHLNDSDFSIDKLACYMNMSRSTLDRKIKDLVRLTTNDFIKLTRIKKAAQMLSEGSFRINEICYLTGFTSPSYFSKCFRKQFGIAPTELLQKREQSKS